MTNANRTGDTEEDRLSIRYLRVAPFIVLVLVFVHLALNFATNLPFQEVVKPLAAGLTVIFTAMWFIACFTGDAVAKRRYPFVFAYAFTFGAFAMLVAPLTLGKDEKKEATTSVIRIFRGCIRDDASAKDLSLVMVCPKALTDDTPTAPVPPAAPAMLSQANPLGRDFGWLVSIGGVTVNQMKPLFPNANPQPTAEQVNSYFEVHGGLAVPLFVILLAFIGGAVSLSRRLPEYQRRSDPEYSPTDKEPTMKDFQAREAVVFQIMQLISAPFLAIATWYIIGPTSLASAAVLAFGTGFASETILLMIRGMVEGIRPEGTRLPPPKLHELTGTIFKESGGTRTIFPDATVSLQMDGSAETRTAKSNAKGEFVFSGVPVGKAKLQSTHETMSATVELTISEKAPKPVELVLK